MKLFILSLFLGTVLCAFKISFASSDNEGRIHQNPPKEPAQKEKRPFQPLTLGNAELPLDVNKQGNLAGYGNLRNRRLDDTDEHKESVKIRSTGDDQSNPRSPPGESASGAIYVRWGHHSCPSSSQLVYTVCLATARFAKLIIPGTNVCPSNEWTREYGGYLMSARVHSVHKRSTHVCVDREMQVIPSSDGIPPDTKRDSLNLVEARCSSSGAGGGIPCGPYVMAMN
ncbi:hypothetical protein BSL78_10415 [Apostichopus japonicus]|uniref:Secreted protein n=1 Tax=Stichopus japonicus TaxID=307972 RepID=A0A2G8KXG4_STIJA|nr:hypothetical protein BSL78_10415 [Apostichopus japonicus]